MTHDSNEPDPKDTKPSTIRLVGWLLAGAITSPLAILLAPVLLFSIALHHRFVLMGLARTLGLQVTEKQAGPLVWPLAGTLGLAALIFVGQVIFSSFGLGAIGVVAGAVVFALVVGPLSFYVPAGIDTNGVSGASAAMRHWDAVSGFEKLRLLSMRVFSVILPLSAYLLVKKLSEDQVMAALVAAVCYPVGLGLYQWVLVATYMKVPLPEGTDISLGQNRRRLMFPLAMTLLLVVPLAVLFGWTTVSTAPMKSAQAPHAHVYGGRPLYTVPNTAMTLTPQPDGIMVETHDGGGAGMIRYGMGCEPEPLGVEIGIVAAAPHFDVYVSACDRWYVLELDEDGVRRDDGFRERVIRGLGIPMLSSFFLALLVFAFAAWRLVPSLAAARRIHAVVRVEDLASGDQQSILAGRLTLAAGGVKRRRLVGEGAIEIRLGPDLFRIPLPEGGVSCSEGAFQDGADVCLVGHFSSMSRGHRDATIPWPKDAFLVEGDVGTARERWLWAATRGSRLTAAAANLLLITCYAWFVLHLLPA